jgi:hypothetical protein
MDSQMMTLVILLLFSGNIRGEKAATRCYRRSSIQGTEVAGSAGETGFITGKKEEMEMTWWMWLLAIGFVLAGLNKGAEENKRKEAEKEAAKEAERRRQEAEDYIMNSGDLEAIKALMLARANPVAQSQFSNGATNGGNSTLKTAAAVAAGVVVGEAVIGAATASAMSSALDAAAKTKTDGVPRRGV